MGTRYDDVSKAFDFAYAFAVLAEGGVVPLWTGSGKKTLLAVLGARTHEKFCAAGTQAAFLTGI